MAEPYSRLMWTAPSGWFHKESITLLHPEGIANVIFSSEPLSEEIDAESYAREHGNRLRNEFHGFTEIEFTGFELGGIDSGFKRKFTWHPPDGEAVTQVQIYAVRDGRGYTATATTTSAQFDSIDLILLDVLDSLAVKDA